MSRSPFVGPQLQFVTSRDAATQVPRARAARHGRHDPGRLADGCCPGALAVFLLFLCNSPLSNAQIRSMNISIERGYTFGKKDGKGALSTMCDVPLDRTCSSEPRRATTSSWPAESAVRRCVSAGSEEKEMRKVYVSRLPAGCTSDQLRTSFGR